MRASLATLLTLGRSLVRVKDRAGAYKLPSGNVFPKFGPAGRQRVVLPSAVRETKPVAQPNLFADAASQPCELGEAARQEPRPTDVDGPGRDDLPVVRADVADKQQLVPTNGDDPGRDDLLVVRADVADKITTYDVAGLVPTDGREQAALLLRWWGGCRGIVTRVIRRARSACPTSAGVWGKVAARVPRVLKFWTRSKTVDARPRAQAELALEKVTVVRNDLTEADLVVVTAERKATAPDVSSPAKVAERPAARNPWKPVTARWVKLNSAEAAAARVGEIAETQP
jgi:hypothetical protein